MSNEFRQVDLMIGGVRRRRWTTERKLQIIEESYAPGETISCVTRSIGEGEVEHVHKIKVWDKNSALEKIAKHLGMFIERVEHSGSMSLNVLPEDAEL